MPGPEFVQQAFKSALLGGESNLDNVSDLTLEATKFKDRFQSLVVPNNLSNAAFIAGASLATVAALGTAYYLIKTHIDSADDERQGFIDSVDANVVSFFIPDAKDQRRDCSKYIAAFITEIEKNPTLYKFSGLLKKTIDKGDKKGTKFSAFSVSSLPFGVNFDQPREDGDNVDEATQAINFLLGGEFLDLLDKVKGNIKHNFINDSKLFVDAHDHIQDLNATRLIAITLANISINLIQGVNPQTKQPFTTDELYTLCGEFKALLLKLKLGIRDEVHAFKDDLCEAHKLQRFIDRLEERIDFLQRSYKDKLRNDLNLSDVINSGYSVIQNTTRTIRRLLYPDGRLENPAMFFSKLIDLNIEIKKNPELLPKFIKKLNMREDDNFLRMELNPTPSTVIDLLAIYASHYRDARKEALNKFKSSDSDFVETLKYFDENYIEYIEDLINAYGLFNHHNKDFNSAREYLVCFISLMLEAHNVTLLDKKEGFLSSNEQALQFLREALADEAHYSFKYILDDGLSKNLRNYLRDQINLVITIRQLSLMTTLTEINSGYLQLPKFQAFVKEKLQKLQEYKEKFIDSKDDLIEVSVQNNTVRSLIFSEINHEVPNKFTNLVDLCNHFDTNIKRAIEQIYSKKFKERLIVNETSLMTKIETYDLDPDSVKLYSTLQNVDVLQALTLKLPTKAEESDIISEKDSITSTGSNANYAPFQLKVLNAIGIVSGALLVIGLVTLLLMIYGPSSLSSFLQLSATALSALIITGFASSAVGGVGLATSYFASSFFKKPNCLIPVKDDDYIPLSKERLNAHLSKAC